MNDKEIAQHFHDAFTSVADGLSRDLRGNAASEDVVRGMMMGAASFCAATWAASTRASGVDLALTKATMLTSIGDFYQQAMIPQTLRR